MTDPDRAPGIPRPRYIPADHVLSEMARFGDERLNALGPTRVLVLAVMGGGFITVGALFSLLLADGVGPHGLVRLLEGLGFSTGFFFVVLAEAVLFTEANVVIPATLLDTHEAATTVVQFWLLAFVGNLAGALLVAGLIAVTQDQPAAVTELLRDVVDRKMEFHAAGGTGDWFRAVLSGVLANWLVGMAAFFATMGRTILGKFVPVALAVTLFVAANFQHSPANMGYFSLLMTETDGPGWIPALTWNLIPVGLGNLVGGTLLVAAPFWYAFRPFADTPEDERDPI